MAVSLVLIMVVFVICAYALWRVQSRRSNEPPIYPGAWPLIGHVPSLIGRKSHPIPVPFHTNCHSLFHPHPELFSRQNVAYVLSQGHIYLYTKIHHVGQAVYACKGLYNYLRQVALDLPSGEGITYIMVGPKKLYVICDPDDSLIISNQCLDKSIYYDFGKTWLGESLIISESSTWKKDRKMIMPAFHHHVMEGFMETFNKQARVIVEKLSSEAGKGRLKHLKYINEYAMDTLCQTVLGVEIADKKKYMQMTETIMSMMVKRFLNPFFYSDIIYSWSNLKKVEDKYTNYFHSISDELIEKKRSERKTKPYNSVGTKNNFLELLLEMSTRETMTDKQLRDQLNLMIVAGYDTTSITTSTALILIGSYKDVQEKIYEEIKAVLGDTDKDVEKSDFDRLVYLEAVIKETLRLYPTAPVVLREVKEDLKLAKYTLYAGNSCILFLGGLNMHPKIWGDDTQQFKPERWLHPSTVPDHPAAFAGFSIGRRNCIGKYYAMMSMKIVLAHIIRKYIISADLTKMEFGFKLLNAPDPNNCISLQKRL